MPQERSNRDREYSRENNSRRKREVGDGLLREDLHKNISNRRNSEDRRSPENERKKRNSRDKRERKYSDNNQNKSSKSQSQNSSKSDFNSEKGSKTEEINNQRENIKNSQNTLFRRKFTSKNHTIIKKIPNSENEEEKSSKPKSILNRLHKNRYETMFDRFLTIYRRQSSHKVNYFMKID